MKSKLLPWVGIVVFGLWLTLLISNNHSKDSTHPESPANQPVGNQSWSEYVYNRSINSVLLVRCMTEGKPDPPAADSDNSLISLRGHPEPDRAAEEGSPRSVNLVASAFFVNAQDPTTRTQEALTNRHVVKDLQRLCPNRIAVLTFDKKVFKATVGRIAQGPNSPDLAILIVHVDGPRLPLPLADFNLVKVAEPVLAIGNPIGLSFTTTSGIVSAIRQGIPDAPPNMQDKYVQTDALINPGSSGSPLLNDRGQVIAINTITNSQFPGLGFAIASDQISNFLSDKSNAAQP